MMKWRKSDIKMRRRAERTARLEQLRLGNRGAKGGSHKGSKAERNKTAARRANRDDW